MELKVFLRHYEAPCIIYILSNPDRNIEIQYSYIIWGILANFETTTDYIQSLCVIGRVTRYYNHKHYVLLGGYSMACYRSNAKHSVYIQSLQSSSFCQAQPQIIFKSILISIEAELVPFPVYPATYPASHPREKFQN